ncbi:MAG: hypothetical protein PHU42_02175 [Patescibacteria group bacterium]|nr:hypothetical protein [Patescibacteria group bacterium]
MTQKKTASDWFLGLIHFFLAGIFYPYVLTWLFVVISVFVLNLAQPSPTAFTVINAILIILGFWAGSFMFSKSVSRKYIVSKNSFILNYSAIFYIIYRIVLIVMRSNKTDLGMNIGIAVFEILLYYIISKKYIAKIISE